MNGSGCLEVLARWLIQHAARNAPSSLAQRLEEEWLADLESRRGAIARLRLGVGCCWARRVITQEFCAAKLPAAATVAGVLATSGRVRQPFPSRRVISLLLIVGLHAALIYALATGLAHRTSTENQWMTGGVLPEPPRSHEPLPPPPRQPTFSHPRIDIPIPEVPIDVPPDPDPLRGSTPLVENPVLLPAATEVIESRVPGGPGGTFPNTDDFYPSTAKRMGEKGTAAVRVCVDEMGRLTAIPTIAQSSGVASLDEGALQLARAGSGHYRPTTEGGRPVSSCYSFRIRFDLKD
jgi:periplasmic protein TonB